MKYFTAEIWAGWQGDEAAFDRAQKKGTKNRFRYRACLSRLVPKLGTRHGQSFTKHSLHDGRLLLFAVSGIAGVSLGKKRAVPETRVEIAVLAGYRQAPVYRLFYTGVSDISVQTKNDLFPLDNSRFGDWGYDELLGKRGGMFRHNILFQTGTEVSIAFHQFRFATHKAIPSRLKQYANSA